MRTCDPPSREVSGLVYFGQQSLREYCSRSSVMCRCYRIVPYVPSVHLTLPSKRVLVASRPTCNLQFVLSSDYTQDNLHPKSNTKLQSFIQPLVQPALSAITIADPAHFDRSNLRLLGSQKIANRGDHIDQRPIPPHTLALPPPLLPISLASKIGCARHLGFVQIAGITGTISGSR